MPTRPLITLLVLLSCSASAVLAKVPDDTTTVSDLSLSGLIDGRNITFTLSCDVETRQNDQRMALLAGDVVLDRIESPKGGYRIQYDPADKSYRIEWPRRGTRRLAVVFVVRPRVFKDTNWHEATFQVPASRYRRLQVVCARTDIQVQFPNAMRVERSVVDGRLVMTAVQGPGQDFQVRWKPHVQKLDAELVMSSEVNTIVTAGPAALRVDSLFEFDVSQGSVQNVTFDMPAGLRVTHVRGAHVRDWSVADEVDKAVLTVTLTEPQSEHYRIQVQAQIAIAGLPAEISVPAICPADGVRTGGQLAAGTNSAIALVVEDTSGLSQIDVSAFQRAVIDEQHPRPLPNGKGFYYNFAGGSYRMHLALKDMVPVFDAAVRGVLRVLDDNLSIDLQVELDVRDAPLRDVVLHMPPGYLAAEVSGEAVGDHSLDESAHGDAPSDLQIRFKQPVLGRTLLALRLELGHSPLHKTLKIGGLAVRGAQTQRGYVLIVPADGIDLDEPDQQGLRQVHTGSVPLRVANAAYAYRFRDTGWSLELSARPRPADVRVELFHLITLADGVAYGGIAVNYFISGAPLDELHFQVPTSLANVEFVGRDVVRAVAEGDDRLHYRVKLNRKVVGDYNLGITYTQPQRDGQAVLAGAITCDRVRSQVGFITIASHLNVQVKAQPVPGAALLQIGREEVPANYRLLVNAPILETYKYVNTPHGLSLGVQHFERGSLLPVVIEVVDLNTRIAMPPSGMPQLGGLEPRWIAPDTGDSKPSASNSVHSRSGRDIGNSV